MTRSQPLSGILWLRAAWYACLWTAALPVGQAVAADVPQAMRSSGGSDAPELSALTAPQASTRWPRLFYSPEQRLAIVRQRQGGAPDSPLTEGAVSAPALVATFALQGMASGRAGGSVWINGQVLRDGEAIGGRTVRIGPQGVRLTLTGEPDIVLRPGQQSTSAGQAPTDVLTSGSFQKK